MTTLSKRVSPISSWWTTFLANIAMPNFKFMVHDRWANVLFLHLRIPSHLEAILEENTSPFVLERYDDGSAWIGLILLTEQNVGPSVGRTKWTCVTHHGINVRTYVRGVVDRGEDKGADTEKDSDETNNNQQQPRRGIHFSSLECDDEFTSFGANFFGMPYQVAKMMRNYFINDNNDSAVVKGNQRKEAEAGAEADMRITTKTTVANTTRLADEAACSGMGPINGGSNNEASSHQSSSLRHYYRIRSERLRYGAPSLFRMLFRTLQWPPKILHSTILTSDENDSNNNVPENDQTKKSGMLSSSPSPTITTDQPQQQFTVDCSWSRCEQSRKDDHHRSRTAQDVEFDDNNNNNKFSKWAVERYFVYTQKYGLNWRGQVDHEPWPIETDQVRLERLEISGIDTYEPKRMRPILSYMAETQPDHIGFSPGVGPVRFSMLRPM